MSGNRLRAPAGDGALLARPALDAAPALIDANRRQLAGWHAPIHGLPADTLRQQARAAALTLAGLEPRLAEDPARPWVVTGHQPELFHPGVWVKNFAVGALARAVGGFGLHLVVDNDLPKAAAVRVPSVADDGRLRLVSVPFDTGPTETPYEDWTVRDEALFRTFCGRSLRALGGLVRAPLLVDFWPRVLASEPGPIHPARRFVAARSEIERAWGLDLPHVPLGALCETPPFLRFACHLLAHAGRFRDLHNRALLAHRRANRIRSRNHPVPELIADDHGWIETPFWTWTRDEPRRRPLLARLDDDRIALRPAGRPPFLDDLPADPARADAAIDRLSELPRRGIRLRTRALTTTMFARLFLADAFVHGIGGAKYDELGDQIIRECFDGLPPPEFLVLSQTDWLGLDDHPGAAEALKAARLALRDLTYNPERHLAPGIDPRLDEWLARKQAAIESAPVATHAERVARWRTIRACSLEMHPFVADRIARLQQEIQRLESQVAWNGIAHHRDLAFPLHHPDRLRTAFSRVDPWSDRMV